MGRGAQSTASFGTLEMRRIGEFYAGLVAVVFLFGSLNAFAQSAEDIPLLAATIRGDAESVNALLTAGTDPDVHDAVRNTSLI